MYVDPTMTLARVVLDHPACAHVLRSHDLDYCCRGALTVTEACMGKGVDATSLLGVLEAAIAGDDDAPARDPRALSTPEILDDLRAGHRRFLQRATLVVAPLLVKAARAHADDRPRLAEVLDVFSELLALLEPHIEAEERVLFPALLSCTPDAPTRVVLRELRGMRREHLVLGERLTRIRSATDDFSVPPDACGSYRALMLELSALDDDLCRHVHVENHVLMGRFAPSR